MTKPDPQNIVEVAANSPWVRIVARVVLALMAYIAFDANAKLNTALEEQSLARAERNVFDSRITRNEKDIDRLLRHGIRERQSDMRRMFQSDQTLLFQPPLPTLPGSRH